MRWHARFNARPHGCDGIGTITCVFALMANAVVWTDVVRLGRRAAHHFNLPYRKRLRFEPLPVRKGSAVDGDCDVSSGLVRIRVHRIGRPTQALTRSTIMATLAHELAHFAEPNHEAGHGELTRQIAAWLRAQGQPVSHILHDVSNPKARIKRTFRRAWKNPKPRKDTT